MKTLYLYTTLGCHLCEEAELMMEPLLREKGFDLKKIEISESEKLVEQYGIRIPVIGLPEEHPQQKRGEPTELGWPFDLNQLKQFLTVAK
ncbi:MAG: glutaredoxin family protein [Pseudomonadales bacterium]|nr:glutaredoxin family protein [Pseudomonadales bacterium]